MLSGAEERVWWGHRCFGLDGRGGDSGWVGGWEHTWEVGLAELSSPLETSAGIGVSSC